MSSLYFDIFRGHGCVPIRLLAIVIAVRCHRVSTTALLVTIYVRHAAYSAPRAGRAEVMLAMVENHQPEAQIVLFPHQSRGSVFRGPLHIHEVHVV
jgi:hypothetical protein